MRKSCIVQLILLVAAVVVLSLLVRQVIRGTDSSGMTITGQKDAPAEQATLDLTATEPAILSLASSRPVMLSGGYPVGLAAKDGSLYLACQHDDAVGVFVARVSLADYAVAQTVDLSTSVDWQAGGMAASADAIWLALRAGGDEGLGLLVALDPETLERQHTVSVAEPLMAVAVAPDGTLYGSTCASGEVVRLSAEGQIEDRAGSAEGVCYSDLAYAEGALLGVATTEAGGVLDVLDPDTLKLVVRHALPLTSARSNPVAGNALAYAEGVFYFAPDRNANPTIMSFTPRNGALSEIIP